MHQLDQTPISCKCVYSGRLEIMRYVNSQYSCVWACQIGLSVGGLSSKFDKFLADGRNSTAIMASIFMRLHVANPRP